MILNLLVQFRVLFFLVSLLVLGYSSNLAIVLQVFCLFYLLFLQFAVLLLVGFVVMLSSLCFSVPLWFGLNRMPSLHFSCRKASLPFFNLLPIVPGFCITISICDSLLQTQLLRFLLLSGLLHVLEGILRYFQGT